MAAWNPKANEIFVNAVELALPDERRALLDLECVSDAGLREQVEKLLQAHDSANSFLQQPAPGCAPTVIPEKPANDVIGSRIGPYKLLQEIGVGGMGTVFMAEQTAPVKRMVALKVIKPGMDTAQVVARFEAERQALALMDHPNIAKVLDAGTTDAGRPYFVMELVKGVAITKYCDEHQLTPRERMELFVPVCQAIQHAHQKGIIHRDLKPSNVMIASFDGRPVPKVIDFGVAKAMGQQLTERTLFTGFGGIVGTLEYMSPEQAEFNALDVDTRSDIYSLGVLLYELLTGSTPLTKQQLKQAAITEVLRLIREEEPQKPSTRLSESRGSLASLSAQRKLDPAKLTKELSGELDWIVLKALEKDRTRRYETANGLARDIEHFLRDEQVEACPPTVGYRLRKFSRKHHKTLVTAAAFVLIFVMSFVAVAWQAYRASVAEQRAVIDAQVAHQAREAEAKERGIAQALALSEAKAAQDAANALIEAEQQRQHAEEEREKATIAQRNATAEARRADAKADEARRSLYVSHMNLVQTAWENARVARVLDLLKQYEPQTGAEDLRGFEWHYWNRLAHFYQMNLKGHAHSVSCVAFSPEGKRLASASVDRTIKVWDVTNGEVLLTLKGHTSAVRGVAYSPDGKRLASAGYDQTVKVWDATNGQELLTLKGHSCPVLDVAFSPDGNRLASAGGDVNDATKSGEVKLWDATTGQELLMLKEHSGVVFDVAFSPDGNWLASASGVPRNPDALGEVKLWDATSGEVLLTMKGHSGPVSGVAFSPDGKRVASAGGDSTVRVWDATSGKETRRLQRHNGMVADVAFSPDGKRLASVGTDQTVNVWDATSGQEMLSLQGHSGSVSSVVFSPDGNRLASGSSDGTVKMWDATNSQEPLKLRGHTGRVWSVAFSPDGQRVVSGGDDQTVKVWDATSGQETSTFNGHTDRVSSVAFSPDGQRLASGGDDRTVKVWDATTGQPTLTLPGHTQTISSVAFSPDGKRLASVSWGDPMVKVWSTTSGELLLMWKGHTSGARGVAFSPDGNRLASASDDQTVKVWDSTTGHEVLTLKGHTSAVKGVAFSPDGKRLASASGDNINATMPGEVKVWDATSGTVLLALQGHTGRVTSVAFSPDGKRLASCSVDRTVKVWDASSGQETLTFQNRLATDVLSVAFSPDGNRLASGDNDRTVTVWDATPRPVVSNPK